MRRPAKTIGCYYVQMPATRRGVIIAHGSVLTDIYQRKLVAGQYRIISHYQTVSSSSGGGGCPPPTLISYIGRSECWIVRDKKKFIIGGNTTRATFDSESKCLKMNSVIE